MAQHNNAHFYGMVQTNPTVVLDDETGQVKTAAAYIITASSTRRYEYGNEENTIRFDQMMIRSGYPETAAQIAKLRQNDIVILKGCITTRNVNKNATCPNEACGRKFTVNENRSDDDENPFTTSMITFITPIAIDIRMTGLTEDAAMEFLVQNREMSNEIQIIGNLCADPVQWEGGKATSYQVGINRKFYLHDDDPSTYADFPYVRSYGLQAGNDIEALHKGSLVLIDGFVKMRHFSRKSTCPYCGTVKEWTDKVLEVIPYSVEYLADYKSGKDRAAEKADYDLNQSI